MTMIVDTLNTVEFYFLNPEYKMLYRRLGNTGLKVSELCLGTMTFGTNSDRPGNCDEALSHNIMDR